MTVRYETTGAWVALSIAAGAVLGAAIIYGEYLWGAYASLGSEHFFKYGFMHGSGVFMTALIGWTIGICVFGGPVWIILHGAGWRQPWVVGSVAAIIPFIVTFALNTRLFAGQTTGKETYFARGGLIWEDGVLTAFGWWNAFQGALFFALYGFLVGLLIWRVAYRRSADTQSR